MSYDLDEYTSEAEDELCRDARALANFFDSEIGVHAYPRVRQLRPEEVIDCGDAGKLLTIVFDAGQPGLTQLTALRRLREMFLEQVDVREVAQRLMNEAHPELTAYAEERA